MHRFLVLLSVVFLFSGQLHANYSFSFKGNFEDGALGRSDFLAEVLFDDLEVDNFISSENFEQSTFNIASLVLTTRRGTVDLTTDEARFEFDETENEFGNVGNGFALRGTPFSFNISSRGVFQGTDIFNLNQLSGLSDPANTSIDGGGFAFASVISTNLEVVTPLTKVAPAVPEPATWIMMILGFVFVGIASSRREKLRLKAN